MGEIGWYGLPVKLTLLVAFAVLITLFAGTRIVCAKSLQDMAYASQADTIDQRKDLDWDEKVKLREKAYKEIYGKSGSPVGAIGGWIILAAIFGWAGKKVLNAQARENAKRSNTIAKKQNHEDQVKLCSERLAKATTLGFSVDNSTFGVELTG